MKGSPVKKWRVENTAVLLAFSVCRLRNMGDDSDIEGQYIRPPPRIYWMSSLYLFVCI